MRDRLSLDEEARRVRDELDSGRNFRAPTADLDVVALERRAADLAEPLAHALGHAFEAPAAARLHAALLDDALDEWEAPLVAAALGQSRLTKCAAHAAAYRALVREARAVLDAHPSALTRELWRVLDGDAHVCLADLRARVMEQAATDDWEALRARALRDLQRQAAALALARG